MAGMVGAEISHYRILQPLGRGGMGEVFLAEDLTLPRKVALKLLSSVGAPDEERVERFIREAMAAARVDHPGVVTVYEAGRHEGTPFLAMQYVEGRTLEARFTDGPLPIDECVRIGIQVADVLSEVHALGIVHRDLKAANLILTPKGTVKLLDFGVASLRGATAITLTGMIPGTPDVLSPEQIRGDASDGRADLWALGVLLYRALAGRHPFPGDRVESVVYSIVNESPPAPAGLRPDVPADLDHVVRKLLRKDPEHRYQRAEEVLADLRAIAESGEEGAAAAGVPASPRAPKLAVLYFEARGSDPEESYLAAGLTEDLIVDLMQVSGVQVTPRSEVLPLRERHVPARTLARELGVEFLLTGSVRRLGNRARITVELVRARDGQAIWAERFDCTVEDLFEAQAEVSRRIVEALEIRLSPGDRARLEKAPTSNPEAYRLYLQARGLLDRRTPEGARMAIEFFRGAIELDPGFALGHAGLAGAYATQACSWWAGREAADLAVAEANRALELSPGLYEADLALCQAYRVLGDGARTREHGERVLSISPDDPEALEQVGWSFLAAGDFARARPLFERLARSHPEHVHAWSSLDMALLALGDTRAAAEARARHVEASLDRIRRDPGDATTRARLASTYGRMGERRLAMEQGERALQLAPNDGQVKYNYACALALLGERDRAVEVLKKAVEGMESFFQAWPLRDPDLESLRDHPEFRRLFGAAPMEDLAPPSAPAAPPG
jgi:TolB-like protein/Tfp pilus assembly protein PilF